MLVKVLGKLNLKDKLLISFCRESLEEYRYLLDSGEASCALCGSKRYRTELLIIDLMGQRLTVGKNCLDKLLGVEASNKALQEAMQEAKEIKATPYNLEDLIDSSYSLILKYGFVSKKEALDSGKESTLSRLMSYKGVNSVSIYKALKAYFEALNTSNPFLLNCKGLLSNVYVSDKALAFVPAMVFSYIQHLETEKAKALMDSQYLELTKYFDVDIKVLSVSQYESLYGTKYRNYLVDLEGHIMLWDTDKALTENDTLIIKSFTVKSLFESKVYGKVSKIVRAKF